MIPYIVIDRIIIGPIKLYTWGLFVGLGFSAGYLLFYYLAKREGLAPAKIVPLSGTIFAGAILGAKILAWALAGDGAMFMAGLVGGIVSGVLCLLLTPPNHSLRKGGGKSAFTPLVKGGLGGFWQIADLLVLPICLGVGIGRIGCILINDHQGAATNLPWGILWPDGTLRHPVGIYEMLVGFGLLAVFWFLSKKLVMNKNSSVIPAETGIQAPEPGSRLKAGTTERRKEGQLFLLFLIFYSLIRFFLEFTRVASGPLADPRWGFLSVSQWLAALLLTLSIFMVLLSASRKQRN